MRQNFFSEQELQAMPLGKLQRLVMGDGIKSPDEEQLVERVMNQKRGFAPMQQRVTLRKDLDIVSQKQEQEWEMELARRESAMRPAIPVAPVVQAEVPTVEQVMSLPEVQPLPVVSAQVEQPQPIESVKIKAPRKPRVKKA